MKVQVFIQNSYSRVSGLTPDSDKRLRSLLSYEVGDYFSKFGPKRRSLLDRKGNFPTGIIKIVLEFLAENHSDFEVRDLREKPKSNGKAKPGLKIAPREFQEKALEKVMSEPRGIISAVTGSGKSIIIGLIASRLNVKTLVVVPSLEIKKQLLETFQTILDDTSKITVENIDSKALQTKGDYDCLIIDEGHHAAAKTYQKLNKNQWAGIYYRYFLTATPFRNNREEMLLFEGIAGEIIFEYTYRQAVKDRVVVSVEAYAYEVQKQPTEAFTWAQVYSELVVNNDARNELIGVILLRLNASQKSTLCLVKEVAHGQRLADLTGLPFVHGQDEESRAYIQDFNSGGIKCLIGTTGILGEGVDTKPCEFVVVAGLGKAKSQFMQQIGRCLRAYPGKESGKIILFLDKSHKFCIKHYNAQRSVLKEEYGVPVIKLKQG